MKTNAEFKLALKELMKTISLDEISVPMLCESCNCTRQTFYYYFRDVLDLYTEVILSEKIDGLKEAKNLTSINESILNFTVKRYQFLSNSYNGGASSLTSDYLAGCLMEKALHLHSISKYTNEDIDIYRIAVRRYSKYISNEITYFLSSTLIEKKSYEKHMRKFMKVAEQNVLPMIINCVKIEKGIS